MLGDNDVRDAFLPPSAHLFSRLQKREEYLAIGTDASLVS